MLDREIIDRINLIDWCPQPKGGICFQEEHRLYHMVGKECPCNIDSWGMKGYKILLAAAGARVVLDKGGNNDYQGDYYLLVQDVRDERFGYTTFGYGSCSGCDALAACMNDNDYIQLRDQLVAGIHWEDTPEELAQWLEDRDWEVQLGYNDEARKELCRIAVGFLRQV